MKLITFAIALLTASAFAADKPSSAKVTGTVVAPKAVKDIAGLTLELRLYEYDPLLADAAADLVAKLRVKNLAHKKGKETKTKFTLAEGASIMPRRSLLPHLLCHRRQGQALSHGREGRQTRPL